MDTPVPPGDAELFGREVARPGGRRVGRIEAVVHLLDGERLALVRRGRLLPRWYRVSLAGAALRDGRVVTAD